VSTTLYDVARFQVQLYVLFTDDHDAGVTVRFVHTGTTGGTNKTTSDSSLSVTFVPEPIHTAVIAIIFI
jgi:hypothetical protein